MSCTNCFNGCAEITSDQCVRYTGPDLVDLGIYTNDTLAHVEQVITNFLTTALNGTGINMSIDSVIICDVVKQYLPEDLLTINLVNIITALTKAACDLQIQVDNYTNEFIALNLEYDISCLTGVTVLDDTHTILQATIDKVCATDVDVAALALDLSSHYVKAGNELDTYIANYLASTASTTTIKNKMIPYVAVEYYGSTDGKFDFTGSGYGDWVNIYLCNGNNGTPDKRGRVAVGATTMGSGAFNVDVDPALGNPTYSLNTPLGKNNITLTASSMPKHTHIATPVVADATHSHLLFNSDAGSESEVSITATTYPNFRHDVETGLSYRITGTSTGATLGKTSLAASGISVSVTNAETGSGLSHSNIQPVLGCYYIMYIP